ncbi:MAG TPA: 50S ribosomal protein L4 [Bacteroidetes bacterium]|jgi:large subunit ribosomal protein L4|nr:50S ribosomal protein L4 [Bacteroidota bacterium]|tara:strand:- start:402 stop:1028 length:627 start_codon:yes stop_codon:yes gene_type:complete
MKVKVINTSGVETGKEVTLPQDIFGVEPNDHAIYLDVKQFLANQRHGTHSSTEKGDVKGSTRKIKKQKGTGTARAGSIKSGVFVGGGRMHGPRPRDYSFKLNKKLKLVARASALSYKAKDNEIVVLDAIEMAAAKTKGYTEFLTNLKLNDKKTLLLLPEYNSNVYLSARNIPNAVVMKADDVNTYNILHANKIIMVEGSIDKLIATFN